MYESMMFENVVCRYRDRGRGWRRWDEEVAVIESSKLVGVAVGRETGEIHIEMAHSVRPSSVSWAARCILHIHEVPASNTGDGIGNDSVLRVLTSPLRLIMRSLEFVYGSNGAVFSNSQVPSLFCFDRFDPFKTLRGPAHIWHSIQRRTSGPDFIMRRFRSQFLVVGHFFFDIF